MTKALITCAIIVLGVLALHLGSQWFDLGGIIMRLHGR